MYESEYIFTAWPFPFHKGYCSKYQGECVNFAGGCCFGVSIYLSY